MDRMGINRRIRAFLRDRRGAAIIDYAMAGSLVAATGELAMRHGMALSEFLRAGIAA